MVEVEEEFIRDHFNLTGLDSHFGKQKFKMCLEAILKQTAPSDEDMNDEQFLEIMEGSRDFYGMIHNRFIRSARGLALVY